MLKKNNYEVLYRSTRIKYTFPLMGSSRVAVAVLTVFWDIIYLYAFNFYYYVEFQIDNLASLNLERPIHHLEFH